MVENISINMFYFYSLINKFVYAGKKGTQYSIVISKRFLLYRERPVAIICALGLEITMRITASASCLKCRTFAVMLLRNGNDRHCIVLSDSHRK